MDAIRKITSRDNDQLKFARRVRDGKEDGKIFLEGFRLVEDAARSHVVPDSAFVSSNMLEKLGTSNLIAWLSADRMFEVSESVLQSLADTRTPQGIVVSAERPQTGPETIVLRKETSTPVVVYFHEINTP